MKTFSFFCGFLFLFVTNAVSQNHVPSIIQRTMKSDVVVEGRVVAQQSEWNSSNSRIFTVNEIEFFKKFKGDVIDEHIFVITEGGIVDNDFQFIPHSPQFNLSYEGIFFLERTDSNNFRPTKILSPSIRYSTEGQKFIAVDG